MPNSTYDEEMKAKGYLPFTMGYLTESMKAQAEKELSETEETRRKCLAEMRKEIQNDSKLECPTDDDYLLQFLRVRKFDTKNAFALLQNFYKLKKSYPEIFSCDLDELIKVFEVGSASTLPYRDQNGSVVYLMQLGKWNPAEMSMPFSVTAVFFILLMCIADCATQVCGVHVMVDVRGMSLQHIRSVTPRYLGLLAKALRNCLPIRLQGIHFYNESTFFQYTWAVFKLFLSEKIKKRVHFYGGNQKELHTFIPKAILPTEYGGDYDATNAMEWFIPVVRSSFNRYNKIKSSGYKD